MILIGESDGDLAIFINYRAAVKAIGSLFLFMGIGAYDYGAGLTLIVKLATRIGHEDFMLVSAEHKVRLYVICKKLCPVRIKLLLDIERRLGGIGEGVVTDDDALVNALCEVFVFCILYDLFDKARFATAECLTANGVAVFDARIGLILAAIEHDAPHIAEAEGEIRVSAAGGGVVCDRFGIDSAHIVIAAREDNGQLTLRYLACDLVDRIEIFYISAMVRDIAVEHEQIELIAEIFSCGDGGGHLIVSV